MISHANESDFSEWLRMRRALWPDCAEEMHAFEMKAQVSAGDGDEGVTFVFKRPEGGLGGFVEVAIRDRVDGSMSGRVGYIEGWYVDADLRGQGVGAQLIARAEEWARSQGLTEIASDAEIENTGSIQAHHALGFRETFRLVHFLKPL